MASRLEELFELLQMNEFRDVYGSKLSTGMKQKVSIARALIHDPPVLIFDEPTNGLDVLVQRSVLRFVSSLREQGKAVLFSTHIMREVEKLCDRVAIMHKGRLLAVGGLDELRERYEVEGFGGVVLPADGRVMRRAGPRFACGSARAIDGPSLRDSRPPGVGADF